MREKIEIWIPVKTGGEAIKSDGQHLERIAILIDGYPIFLKKDIYLEKKQITKEEAELLENNLTLPSKHIN